MGSISELLDALSDVVPLGIAGAVLGIFFFALGTYIEAKTTKKIGRAIIFFGFLILFAAIYEYLK